MIKEILLKFINENIKNKSQNLFILKGIDFVEDVVEIYSDLRLDLFDLENISKKEVYRSINDMIHNNQAILVSYVEYLFLVENKISEILHINEYNFNIIDFNFFGNYYLAKNFNKDKISKVIEDVYNYERESIYQRIFSNIFYKEGLFLYNLIPIDNNSINNFVSYNKEMIEINNVQLKYIESNDYDLKTDLDLEQNSIDFVNKIERREPIRLSINNVNVKSVYKFLLSSLGKNNINVQFTKFKEHKPSYIENYLEILHRLNSDYNFRDIDIYSDIDNQENTTKSVSQEEIINEIYINAKSASEGNRFFDNFITAPTGGGKSIMFQIPAIILAEKYKLMTIVVSPLIGLMNDQIYNLERMTDSAATINSEYTPQEKDEIKTKIAEEKISILYLSPETLLANSDIKSIIGNRKIGLIVIDEAHTVSTWGKSFRPDYWFLGDYLKRLRKKDNNFSIVAFTATATYGGPDDMYFDIIDSLFLNIKKPFIGKVKRDNISFKINKHIKNSEYQLEKNNKVVNELNDLFKNNKKTLVYFPFKSTLNEVYGKLSIQIRDKVGKYTGTLDKYDKNENLELFRDSKKIGMLATKAFGMGIDINDIQYIYHYAPTGNLSDYVQEIGRAARKKEINGIAQTDYFKEDFRFIDKLYGLSSIKKYEVVGVLEKILSIYHRENKRNLLVAPEDFSHVFEKTNDDEIDKRIKSVLLIIKKDLEVDRSLESHALVFRPSSLFTKGLFLIKDSEYSHVIKNDLENYLRIHTRKEDLNHFDNDVYHQYPGNVYTLDFKSLWQDQFREMSFAQFKFKFLNPDGNIPFSWFFHSKIILKIKNKDNNNFSQVLEIFRDFIDELKVTLLEISSEAKYFSMLEISKKFSNRNKFKQISDAQFEVLVKNTINLLNELEMNNNFGMANFLSYDTKKDKYILKGNVFTSKIEKLKRNAAILFKNDMQKNEKLIIEDSKQNNKMNKLISTILAQVFEMLKLSEYEIIAGDNPEFFVRINSENSLLKMINNYYRSPTIEKIKNRHEYSIKLMDYFFTKLSDDEERWQMIEDYFIGKDIVSIYDIYK